MPRIGTPSALIKVVFPTLLHFLTLKSGKLLMGDTMWRYTHHIVNVTIIFPKS